MKQIYLLITVLSLIIIMGCAGKTNKLENYLVSFTFEEKMEMRINAKDAATLLKEGKAVLLDVRFAEETKDYNIPAAIKIPLNELPSRKAELPKDKIILTTCLSGERANMARLYLITEGYNARYIHEPIAKVYAAVIKD